MSNQSSIQRVLVSLVGAMMLSAVCVSAAVAPAKAAERAPCACHPVRY